jgi:hypothetical protein
MLIAIIINFIACSICLLFGYVNFYYNDDHMWGWIHSMLGVMNLFVAIAASVDLYYKKKLDSLSKDINSHQ